MFGLARASKAKKIYDSLSSLLTSIEGWTPDKKLPENMWVDPYMIGYFFKTVALLELITNKKPYSSSPDQMIVKLCFEDHICPNNFKEFEKKYPDENNVPRPPHWSGWRVLPDEIEFWVDGEGRIHERLNYKNNNGKWNKELLYP